MLCRHVAIAFRANDASLYAPDGRRVPGLRYEKSSPLAVKVKCKALLRNVRILDHQSGNPALLKKSLTPRTVRRYQPALGSSPPTLTPPTPLGQTVQVDFIDLFSPELLFGFHRKAPWPFQPGSRARLTEKSVREWVLHFRFHKQQPRLSQTFFEVAWPGNGPDRITLLLSALDFGSVDEKAADAGSSRRLGLLHDLVLLIAANRHIKWELVVDTVNLPQDALGCTMPSPLESEWIDEVVRLMVAEQRGGSALDLEVYSLEEYRDALGEEKFMLHSKNCKLGYSLS